MFPENLIFLCLASNMSSMENGMRDFSTRAVLASTCSATKMLLVRYLNTTKYLIQWFIRRQSKQSKQLVLCAGKHVARRKNETAAMRGKIPNGFEHVSSFVG